MFVFLVKLHKEMFVDIFYGIGTGSVQSLYCNNKDVHIFG